MTRKKIIRFCEEYLGVKDFKDYCHNGLQVEGCEEVSKIVSGVSLSQKLIEEAIREKAQMIIVHHGIFGNQIGETPEIKGVVRKRLKLLLDNDMNLAGFHLPLDAHPEIGNNVSLCRQFGLKDLEKFDVGFIGELENEMSFEEFLSLVNEKLDLKAFSINAGSKNVKRVGVISGGASPDYIIAKEAGCDTFVCGDIREEVVRGVEELDLNFINAGHYNTEKLGIMNLGELISKEFGIEHKFIDVPCDI